MTFDAVLKNHGAMLKRIVASYEADPAIAEEVMQEVALAIWRALPRFSGEGSLKAYVARIAQNRCISHVHSAVRQPKGTTIEDVHIDTRVDPEGKADEEQRRGLLLNAVRELPIGLRQVATLALEGLSHRDIGEALGISENNVAVRFGRAKKQLTERVSKHTATGDMT